MTVFVEPGNPKSTHHASLSDGQHTIGLIASDNRGGMNIKAITRAPINRTAMKTTSGNQKYSDYEPPWSPIAQEDWSGGRGLDNFDEEITRYYDGNRANTMFGPIIHGPQEQYCTGTRTAINNLPGNVDWWVLMDGAGKYLANRITVAGDTTFYNIWVLVRRKGTPAHDLTITLNANNAGVPDSTATVTKTITTTDMPDTLSEWRVLNISAGQILTSGTWWIIATSDGGTDTNHWEIGSNPTGTYGKQSTDGTTWVNAAMDMYYRLTGADTSNSSLFFHYKRALYMVRSVASGTSKLYINGDRGTADANTGVLGTLVDATKTWTSDEWVGCYVMLTAGKGSNEVRTWRKITANTATTLTVDTVWEIVHDTTTEYVILGSNKFTDISADITLTARVTDVLVVNNIVFFAQGDATVIHHAKWETSGGNWTTSKRDDTTATNKATFLQTVRNPTSGAIEIWRANNISPVSSKVAVNYSAIIAWGADLNFAGAEITFEDSFGKITGLEEFGETSKYLYVFREGTIYAINAGKPDEIPLREIRTMESDTNGRAHLPHNSNLYFNLGSGLEQFVNRTLTDMGTNRDKGLPKNRRGAVADLQGYPAAIFEAIDAGTTGYSTINGTNLTGWCEMYRAPLGQRIDCIDYQVIPDVGLNRMWASQGNDVIWLPFPSDVIDPTQDENYLYTHECSANSGWLFAGMPDVIKLYNSVKMFSENLVEDEQWVELDFKTDSDTTWTTLDDAFFTSPIQEIELGDDSSIQGKRLCYRVRSYTKDASKTPVINSIVLDTISRIPTKHSIAMTYVLCEGGKNLLGELDDQGSPDEIQEILDDWSGNITKLTFRCQRKILDNMRVFVDPAPVAIIGDKLEMYTGKLTMIEF